MRIKLRNYPLSNNLTVQNNVLVIADLFGAGIVAFSTIMLLGGIGMADTATPVETIMVWAIPIAFFYVVKIFIDKYTDKKYDVVLEEYNQRLAKLTSENPEEVKDKMLTYPAKITFIRVKCNEGKLQKQKFYINDKEYILKNGESVDFTTDKALNTIEVKQLGAKDIKYFTVSDNELIEIKYAKYRFDDIERKINGI